MVFLVLQLKADSNPGEPHSKFLHEYLNLEFINKASIIFWNDATIHLIDKHLYTFDRIYVDNIRKSIEEILSLISEIIQLLRDHESIHLPSEDFDQYSIQKTIAFIK